MYRHHPFIIGASLIALSASAAATSMASVSYGPITMQLIDLDLGDGIDPGISFDTGWGMRTVLTAFNSFDNETQFNVQSPIDQWTSLADQAQTSVSKASVKITGSGTAEGATMVLAGQATPKGAGWSRFEGWADVPNPISYAEQTFTLTQNTSVLFTTIVNVSVSGVDLAPEPELASRASAQLQFAVSSADGDYYAEDWARAAGNSDTTSSFDQSVTKTIDLLFSNRSLTEKRRGALYALGRISGESYVSAVPEPETYLLMLTGCFAVALVVRRQRKR